MPQPLPPAARPRRARPIVARPSLLAALAALLAAVACHDPVSPEPEPVFAGTWSGTVEEANLHFEASLVDSPLFDGAAPDSLVLARAAGTATLTFRDVAHGGLACTLERRRDPELPSSHLVHIACATPDARTRLTLLGPIGTTERAPTLVLANVIDFAIANDDAARIPADVDWLMAVERR